MRRSSSRRRPHRRRNRRSDDRPDPTAQPAPDGLARFEGFAAPGGESFAELRARVLGFLDGLGSGRHLVFTHGGVVRLLLREVGEDTFVPTGTLLVVDWDARRLLWRRDGEGEPSRGLPGPAGAKEER